MSAVAGLLLGFVCLIVERRMLDVEQGKILAVAKIQQDTIGHLEPRQALAHPLPRSAPAFSDLTEYNCAFSVQTLAGDFMPTHVLPSILSTTNRERER